MGRMAMMRKRTRRERMKPRLSITSRFDKLLMRLRKLEALAARPGTEAEGIAARAAIERIKRQLRFPPPAQVSRRLTAEQRAAGMRTCMDCWQPFKPAWDA